MPSTKPYLIRAIHEWCTDQGLTPYLAVSVDATTRVPREFVKDGEIVLNIGNEATQQLSLGNEEITFQARFSGRPFPVVVPVERVIAIYARENAQGMAFELGASAGATPLQAATQDAKADEAERVPDAATPPTPTRPSHLTRIK